MTTNELSKEVEARIKDFFVDVMDPEEMAKIIRQINYALSLCVMRGCETVERFKGLIPIAIGACYNINHSSGILERVP